MVAAPLCRFGVGTESLVAGPARQIALRPADGGVSFHLDDNVP